MKTTNIIIGGGLAGLLSARALEKKGLPYILLEAKAVLGGRIIGVKDKNTEHHHDLGPTWIFPHQHNIQALLTELALPYFKQYTQGDALFQKQGNQGVLRTAGAGAMSMYRIQGGITTLINTLYKKLNPNNIKTSHAVTQVKQENGSWTITAKQQGNTAVFKANNLILALPPRMIIQHLTPTDWASTSLQSTLKQVPTWMAAQAKFIATYSAPFWREQALSGQAFSQQGPMQEMHDACANNNPSYALFGFIGIPAKLRSQCSEAQIKQACLSQLEQLYGDQAKKVENTYLKDWATSEYITSELDLNEPPQHPYFDSNNHQKELTEKKIFLVGSEFSRIDAGYLEGAVCAVNDVMEKIHQK